MSYVYEPETPARIQQLDYTCSANSCAWALTSLGIVTTGPEMTLAMEAAGLLTPELGLLDGSGSSLAEWLRETYGLVVEQDYPCEWNDIVRRSGQGPFMIGSSGWYHWSGLRDAGVEGGRLANPAPSWQGVGDWLDQGEWHRYVPWAVLHIPALQGEVVEDPEVIAELEAQVASLNAQLAECQSYGGALGHDVLRPMVEEMDLATTGASDNQVRDWADRLRPHVIP